MKLNVRTLRINEFLYHIFSIYEQKHLEVASGVYTIYLDQFCIRGMGKQISDQELTTQCDLDLFEEDDMIMADKGFNIQELIAARSVTVNVPPKLESKGKKPVLDVEKTRLNAKFRIHIEWITGRDRRSEILKHKFPRLMNDLVSSSTVFTCSLPILTIL